LDGRSGTLLFGDGQHGHSSYQRRQRNQRRNNSNENVQCASLWTRSTLGADTQMRPIVRVESSSGLRVLGARELPNPTYCIYTVSASVARLLLIHCWTPGSYICYLPVSAKPSLRTKSVRGELLN
jgi:hypothetical protein